MSRLKWLRRRRRHAAGYYEEAGALRDMVQNHMLQVLSLVAMSRPGPCMPMWLRDCQDRGAALPAALRGPDVERCVVRPGYGTGYIHGEEVPGYRREEGLRRDSTTEPMWPSIVLYR